ncbi:MAG: hypothetical protein ACK52I_26850 [Pseudomonadota bacterium]|jgi:hypothetical protein
MASLGDLVVNLTANSKGVQSGLQEAQGYMTAFAAASVAFATASVAQFVRVGSAFDDMAKRTGVSVEALSTLSYAAKLSDTSIESVQGGLMKMAKLMGEVRSGSAQAAEKLQALGLSTTQMLAANPEQQFKMVADAIAGISDPSQQAAAAMEIFGKGAGDLLPLLQMGGKGIEYMQQKGVEFGAMITDDMAVSAAELGDSIDNLLTSFTGLAMVIGSFVADILTPLFNLTAKLVTEYRDFFGVLGIAAAVIGGVVLAMQAVTKAVQAYAKAQAFAKALSGPKGWLELSIGLGLAAGAAALLGLSFAEQNRETEEAARLLKDAADQTERVKKAQAQPQKSVLDVKGENVGAFVKSIEQMNTQSAQGQAEALRRKIAQLTDDFNTLRKLGRTDMTPEQFQSYKQAAIDAFTGVGEKTKELQKELSILRGETTAQEIEFQRMLQAGASNAQIEALRQMQAEREKLLAQQEEEAKRQADITAAAEQSKAALQAEVDAIKDSIKTPKQKLDERLERINELEKSGMLNVMEAALAAKQVQDEMKQLDQQTAPAAVSQEPRFAGAAMRGSGEAFSTILRSMGRKDPVVAATEKQTKDLVAAIKQNKPEFAVAEGA